MGKVHLAWGACFSLVLATTPAGANLLESCPDGVSVNMVIVDGVVDSNAVVECLGDVSPTPVPQATPTPGGSVPTPTPVPNGPADCQNRTLCPNGCLTESILGGYGLSRLQIPSGTSRTYCAPVMPPYASGTPSQIKFQFYDESDKDCGYLIMTVEQTVGAHTTQSTGYPLPNGNILFRSSWGPFEFPDRTALGMYRVTVSGQGGCSTTFRLGWGIN